MSRDEGFMAQTILGQLDKFPARELPGRVISMTQQLSHDQNVGDMWLCKNGLCI